MDKQIQKKKNPKPLIIAAAVVLVGFFAVSKMNTGSNAVDLDKSKLTISTVRQGKFNDFAPIRGAFKPLETVYLDAVEGGNVKQVFVEDGTVVTKGQPLLSFSNTPLLLNAMARETSIVEQTNQLRTTQLNLEQKSLELREDILNTEYRVKQLEVDLARVKPLVKKAILAESELKDLQIEYEYNNEKVALIKEKLVLHHRLSTVQAEQIAQSIQLLEQNRNELKQARGSLTVKAPIDGYLSGFKVIIGESKQSGERLGQIDVVSDIGSNYKIEAFIDEFYITKVSQGLLATTAINNQDYSLIVKKVYPQVKDNKFTADLVFKDQAPDNMRSGQSIQLNIVFSEKNNALLLDRGSFYQDTGGQWAFVLDSSGDFATRRELTVGETNSQYLEIIDGLKIGEQVITSKYANLTERDRIDFKH
jgi:HlyD family secretion protein